MIKRILRQAFILAYLFLTFCALIYTLGRKQMPCPFCKNGNLPWPVVTHFYAMMAPFQNYTTHNVELVAEGLDSRGLWQKIDLKQYLPYSRGETAIRSRMSSFSDKRSKYTAMAKRLLELEADRGREFRSVRLQWEKWPKSQYDFYGGYQEGDIKRTFITKADR